MKLYPFAKLHEDVIENGVGEFESGKPLGITVHYTAGGSATSSIDYLRTTTLRYHLLIDRNGEVYQMVYLDRKVNHAGNASWAGLSPNSNHIAIAIANWGKLEESGGQYQTWARKSLQHTQVARRPFNILEGIAYWERAPLVQERALLACLRWLIKHNGIRAEHICGHDESTLRKIDPGGSLRHKMSEIRRIVCTDS